MSKFGVILVRIFPAFSRIRTEYGEILRDTEILSPTEKTDYRPISILSNISKIYERIMHDNMSDYFNDVLSKFQCGFRKGFGAQNCLLFMIETIRKTRDNHGVFTAVMTDLSKACDCISHEFLIAKLNAHGFDKTLLKVSNSYLKNRTQTTKVGLVNCSI